MAGRLRAVVMLSGGMDSATCLAIARQDGCSCYALSFDYGQRHRAELAAAVALAASLGVVEHRTLHLGLDQIGGSALTDPRIAVPVGVVPRGGQTEAGATRAGAAAIPVTYVPARNTVFMSLALGWAEVLDADYIYTGVNAVDYSGYPDCRPEYLAAFQRMADLATRRGIEGRPILIRAPLLSLSKAEIIRRGVSLGVDYALTVSCYQADAAGRACGQCEACRLRHEGFSAAGVPDVTRYRTHVRSG